MGTTVTALLHSGGKLALAHIGDSRGYLLRDGQLTQITHDHTFVQSLVDEGRLTEEEARSHPQRNLITRVLTGERDDTPDLSVREAKAGRHLPALLRRPHRRGQRGDPGRGARRRHRRRRAGRAR